MNREIACIYIKRGQILIFLHVKGCQCIEYSRIYGEMPIYHKVPYITYELEIDHSEVSQMFINFVVKQEFPPNVHWFYIGSRKK